MASVPQSPRILRISWGELEVEGLSLGRDMKLWPGGGREWDWRETDTYHVPGIQISDVEELIMEGARTVVLAQGMQFMLETCPETLDYLREHGITYHVAETNEAARVYNNLVQMGEQVGGLFHSTC